ncbi:hypothetical protein NLJ89_g8222 [Agrocybe chaxingu]|uniref:Uncharacterized protein n=1 Tax=Agrocybe chaxingu TaxID=84603 RepID=A0A9W8JV41_9AGAR|nr:hypothetical protein NLJ89_g8222 [Agrocybe chaxingu]
MSPTGHPQAYREAYQSYSDDSNEQSPAAPSTTLEYPTAAQHHLPPSIATSPPSYSPGPQSYLPLSTDRQPATLSQNTLIAETIASTSQSLPRGTAMSYAAGTSMFTSSNAATSNTTPSNMAAATQLQGLHNMPIRGTKNAPKTFKGRYTEVDRFIEHYERLIQQYGLVTDSDKCKGLLEYCSEKVRSFLETDISCRVNTYNWNDLKKLILKYYDAERYTARFKPSDLSDYITKSSSKPMHAMNHWKRYYRNYATIAGFLLTKQLLSEREYLVYFWLGLPANVRTVFEGKLTVNNPLHDTANPWTIAQVSTVAEAYFKRNKFSDMILHGRSFGYGREESEDDDEDHNSESEFASSEAESDSDSEVKHKRHRKKAEQKKKRGKEDSLSQLAKPVLERAHKYQGNPEDIQGLIQQLNTMSLEDPTYGPLYFRVMQMDTSGHAAKCIAREPPKYSNQLPNPTVYPSMHSYTAPAAAIIPPQASAVPPQPYPPPAPVPPQPYGFNRNVGYSPTTYPNNIPLGNGAGSNTYPGRPVPGIPAAPQAPTLPASQLQTTALQTNFISTREEVGNFYVRQGTSMESEDDWEEEEQEEQENYGMGAWEDEDGEFADEEAEDDEVYDVYSAERTTRSSTRARKEAIKAPVRKPVVKFDGVQAPPRRRAVKDLPIMLDPNV